MPVFRGIDDRQSPTDRGSDDETFRASEHGSPEQQHRDRGLRIAADQERAQVEQSGRRGREQTQDDRALRAAAVRVVTRPRPRDQRCSELTAGDEADHERAESQSVVDIKREHGHRDADDEKGDEDHAHDRQQRRRKGTCFGRFLHGYNGHGRAPQNSCLVGL